MSVRVKLYMTILILSALVAVVGLAGKLSLDQYEQKVEDLSFALKRVDAVQNRRVGFHQLNRDLYKYFKIRDDSYAKLFSAKLADLKKEMKSLEKTTECSPCETSVVQASLSIDMLGQITDKLITASRNGDERTVALRLDEIDGLITETSNKLALSAQMTNDSAKNLYEESQRAHAQYSFLIILASFMTVGIGILLSHLMVRGIANSTKELCGAALEFANGNRDRRIITRSSDEFATLAHSFNYMASEIQQSELRMREWGEQLEREVDERKDELKDANEEAENRMQRLRAYLEIATALNPALDMSGTLNRAAATLSSMLASDYAAITLVDEDSLVRCWEMEGCGEIQCPAYGSDNLACWAIMRTNCKKTSQDSKGDTASHISCRVFQNISVKIAALTNLDEASFLGKSIPINNSMCGRALFTLKPVIAEDLDGTVGLTSLRDLAPDCVSQISIPLTVKNRVLGTVIFGYRSKQPFSNREIDLIASLTNQLALGIENARLYEHAKRSAAEFSILYRVGETLEALLRKDEISDNILSLAMESLNAEGGIVLLFDQESQRLRTCAQKNIDEVLTTAIGGKTGGGIVGWVAKSGIPVLADKRLQEDRFSASLRNVDYRSALFAPLQYNGDIFGVLGLISFSGRRFDESDLRIIATLCNQAGAAMHNAQLFDQLQNLYIEIVKALVKAIEAKDSYTRGHSENVANYAMAIGSGMDLTADDIEALRIAALLHDIGKIGIKETVLNKPGRLNQQEYDHVKEHPRIAYEIISRIPMLKGVAESILYHHEKYDGQGYGEGLKGEDIPLGARIIAVADTFDAMTSNRPYREAVSLEAAKDELLKNSGAQFDPRIVEVFVRLLDNGELDLSSPTFEEETEPPKTQGRCESA